MTREEILAVAKPILFNTDMVIAILEGRKSVTRRVVKEPYMISVCNEYGKDPKVETFKSASKGSPLYREIGNMPIPAKLYRRGTYLYVRETWQRAGLMDDFDQVIESTMKYYYAAGPETPCFGFWVDPNTGEYKDHMPWRPSIHMPKEAARIFLRVTDVRVERLHIMTLDDFLSEGVVIREEAFNDPDNAYLQAREQFIGIWDATTTDPKNKWEANPWVWVIEFERVEVQDDR